MLTDKASIAFEEGWQDGIAGRRLEWPDEPGYVAGYRIGRAELIDREAFEEEQRLLSSPVREESGSDASHEP